MMHQETISPSVYEASPAEVQRVILDWIRSTEAFHNRYAHLTDVINKLQLNARLQSADGKAHLRKLLLLRQQMSDVLTTLLLDMTGQRSSQSLQPSKPGQLRSHTSLMDELNRKIDAELTLVTTVAQA